MKGVSKTYKVQEIFYSIAGEGKRTGRASIFVRFVGCNLWNGKEADRLKSTCTFCDTNFISMDGPLAGAYTEQDLVSKVAELWGDRKGVPYVVFTGGEPALQLDEHLCHAFKQAGFETAIETNGTRPLPKGLDWICVSPKGNLEQVVVRSGNELKIVYPQQGIDVSEAESWNFEYFYLQPLYDETQINWKATQEYCLANPQWHLSLQMHKVLGLK